MMRLARLALVLAAVLLTGLDAAAQDPAIIEKRLIARGQQNPDQPPPGSQRPMDAQATRDVLQRILFQVPPNVRRVLQLDPSLVDRPDYLAPYPQLAEFLERHPEIARDPAFFFGVPDFNRTPDPVEAFSVILAGIGLFIGFMTVVVLVGSLARQVVAYRRWVRQTRMQAEVHTKILDRLQSNEDLLSYVQTPAGRNFLEFAPPSAEEPPVAAAPFGRILWSIQAGVVLAALGIGLRFAQTAVPEEVVPAFTVLGVIVMALGIGAIVSAAVAYALSSRLGLLPPRRQES